MFQHSSVLVFYTTFQTFFFTKFQWLYLYFRTNFTKFQAKISQKKQYLKLDTSRSISLLDIYYQKCWFSNRYEPFDKVFPCARESRQDLNKITARRRSFWIHYKSLKTHRNVGPWKMYKENFCEYRRFTPLNKYSIINVPKSRSKKW